MRRAANIDYDAAWTEFAKKNKNAADGMMHVVILPNYKVEDL
jgi:hypothetical protein